MTLADAVRRAQDAMAGACARRGRAPGSVHLLAATKGVAPERIREAHALGLRRFGENRVQERESKLLALADLDLEWRLLGPLQRNKAGRALSLFAVVETLDSFPLALRLQNLAESRAMPPLGVLIEVNIGREPQKAGVEPERARELAQGIATLSRLRLLGIMSVPPAAADPEAARPYFASLAALSDELRTALGRPPAEWELSMGMSRDFVVAIEEGATEVRLGTALFGPRPPAAEPD